VPTISWAAMRAVKTLYSSYLTCEIMRRTGLLVFRCFFNEARKAASPSQIILKSSAS